MATFRGLRHVPLIAVSHNSLFPSLDIGDGELAIRVVGRRRLAFAEIEAVDLRPRLAHQVTIIPKTGPWTFSANFLDRASARQVLAALAGRGVPLTPEATRFLDVEPA